LYGGRIRLGGNAGFNWLDVRGDNMQLSLKSTLGIGAKVPLQIPCSHLGLSDGTPFETPHVVSPAENLRIGTGSTFFPLYLGPQEVDPLTRAAQTLCRDPAVVAAAWAGVMAPNFAPTPSRLR
jgi:hypothetical protein